MSIASQITALGNNIGAAYNMINQRGGTVPARKNAENMSTAIATIPSLGSVLWTASGMNPTLVGTYTLDLNLQDDTNYSTSTPSTSEQTLLAANIASLTITGPTLDLVNKRYIIFEDAIVPHTYTTAPSGIAYTTCSAQKFVFMIGRKRTTPSGAANNSALNPVGSNTNVRYYTSSGVDSLAASSYGVFCGAGTPIISSSSSNTPTLRLINPSVRSRSAASIMNLDSWQYLDASNTTIKIRWQIYSVDIPGWVDKAYELNETASLTETFQDNLIMLGGNS